MLTALVAVLTPELFVAVASGVVASGVTALSAACTVSAAAVEIRGSGAPAADKLQDEINTPITRYNHRILFMIFLRSKFWGIPSSSHGIFMKEKHKCLRLLIWTAFALPLLFGGRPRL